jgi:disulfide bond formation protein DsbB
VTLTGRQANLLGFGACAAAFGFALFSQYVLGFAPCHLCIFQRVEVAALGVVFLAAALHDPRGALARVYAALIALVAVATAITAGRHVWIQMQPPGSVPGCGADLAFMLDVLPLMQVVIKVFQAGGECAKVDWTFLGLSMPGWVFLFAVGVGALGVWANWRAARARRQDGDQPASRVSISSSTRS